MAELQYGQLLINGERQKRKQRALGNIRQIEGHTGLMAGLFLEADQCLKNSPSNSE